MPNPDFVKGACSHCAGHIEFATGDAGQTVDCPHCGQSTKLIPLAPPYNPRNSRRLWIVLIIVFFLIATAGGYFYMQKAGRHNSDSAPSLPGTQSNTAVATPPEPSGIETNDFAILPFKLEKTTGSSLVYVTGTIRNTSDRQRFGVKVSFTLFDTNEAPTGSATDYHAVIESHADWHFKALVIESKAVSAKFSSIAEEK